jgi:hypothetical protein
MLLNTSLRCEKLWRHFLNKPEFINNADESGLQKNNKPTKRGLPRKEVRLYTPKMSTILPCRNSVGNFIPPTTINLTSSKNNEKCEEEG